MVHKGLVLIAAAVALVVHFLVFSSCPGQNLDYTAFFSRFLGLGRWCLYPFGMAYGGTGYCLIVCSVVFTLHGEKTTFPEF